VEALLDKASPLPVLRVDTSVKYAQVPRRPGLYWDVTCRQLLLRLSEDRQIVDMDGDERLLDDVVDGEFYLVKEIVDGHG